MTVLNSFEKSCHGSGNLLIFVIAPGVVTPPVLAGLVVCPGVVGIFRPGDP